MVFNWGFYYSLVEGVQPDDWCILAVGGFALVVIIRICVVGFMFGPRGLGGYLGIHFAGRFVKSF